MKTVYFVRHGESNFNLHDWHQDETPELSERGKEQAQVIAERAAHLPVDVVISSTMVRARQTADAIVSKIQKPVVLSDLFIERSIPSELVGTPHGDSESQRIMRIIHENLHDENFQYADEEKFSALKKRAQQAMELLEARSEETLLVVTHGTFLKFLVALLIFGPNITGQEWAKIGSTFRTSNTGITKFFYDDSRDVGSWKIHVWNDHAHLG